MIYWLLYNILNIMYDIVTIIYYILNIIWYTLNVIYDVYDVYIWFVIYIKNENKKQAEWGGSDL